MINKTKPFLASLVIGLLLSATASASQLKPLMDWMTSLVDSGQVVGCMAQVTHDGETIFLEAVGNRTPESDEALSTDQVIRIYSMSKAITSTAIMQLIEQGKLGLDDPVWNYIPEFGQMDVLVDGELLAADRPVTVRDLLTHTSGLSYGFMAPPEAAPYYVGKMRSANNLKEAGALMGGLPLLSHPGESFVYGLNTDVLGRVVEVASDESFGRYLNQNIFKPLGMNHTGFVPDEDLEEMHIVTPVNGELVLDEDHYSGSDAIFKPRFESGGGGLWSTIGDYSRFCNAMINHGELDGTRILKPETVKFMTQNHLAPGVGGPGQRFGLGFGIQPPVQTSKGPMGEGRWSWGGAACTYFFIDPELKITAVFATQQFPFNMQMNDQFHQMVLESVAQMDSSDHSGSVAAADKPNKHILVINFKLKDLSRADYEAACKQVASTFAGLPGLVSKKWLANEDTNTYGGVYLWESKQAMLDYKNSEVFAALGQNPAFVELSVTDFEMLSGPSKVTRAE